MSLHIFHNRADHTHENEQFRRIATDLKVLFEKMKWDGLLIGNPDNPDFRRFRADALLYYNNGLLVIDLKDYSGDIKLPPNNNEFKTTKWYNETEKDKLRIEIKGGSFINPFKQLFAYRESIIELIKSNLTLSGKIDFSKVCSVNIFKGPIKLNRETPPDIKFYRIVQESDFQTFLYDFASPNNYYDSIAEEWRRIFPSEPWIEHLHFTDSNTENQPHFTEIDGNIKCIVSDFLDNSYQQILILESSKTSIRDGWMRYILSEGSNHKIPQTEIWAHSARIAKRIKGRTDIKPSSLYSTLFGGEVESTDKKDIKKETIDDHSTDNSSDIPEQMQEISGIRSDKQLDEQSLIILFEAHLVTRSLHQSELLKFGTGRILEDMFTHLRLNETKRKLICIGDPYSLAYGKEEESALSRETLSEIYKGEILHFRETRDCESQTAINKLKQDIGSSIDENLFNNLHYEWDNCTIEQLDKLKAEIILKLWFEKPIVSEPEYAVLVYKNSDSTKINQWIRKKVQGKTGDFVQGDLLQVNNNFKIPDELGLSYPQQISNGTYLRVESKLRRYSESIIDKTKNEVILNFLKLKVTILNSNQKAISDIWILENYFKNSNELTLQEQIAFRIFVHIRVYKYLNLNSFENSDEYEVLKSSSVYQELKNKQKELIYALDNGSSVKTKSDETEADIKRLEKRAKKRYRKFCLLHVLNSDPFVNAVYVQYGYAMTVNKALGSTFKEVLFNAFRGENSGISNENYFRWFYTGLACVQNRVFIINPPIINPLMNCEFEDTKNIINEFIVPSTKIKLIFPKIETPFEITNLLDENTPENLKRAISTLINILHPKGYLIDKIELAPYLIRSIFSTPIGRELEEIDKLCIVMYYKLNSDVTSVRIEKNGKSELTIIEDSIAEFIEQGTSNRLNLSTGNNFPTDFRQEIYKRWQDRCKDSGYQLSIIEEHAHQDVFLIESHSDHARIRVWYTSSGYFSKVIMIEKSSEHISTEIKNIFFYGIEN